MFTRKLILAVLLTVIVQSILISPALQDTFFTQVPVHMCVIAINCRDNVPADADQPDGGRPLAPLNWSSFRQALSCAGLSTEEMNSVVSEIYGEDSVSPLSNIIPESFGVWHNPYVTQNRGNYSQARNLLEQSGFYIMDRKLHQPNGALCRNITVISFSEAPESTTITQRFVERWNDFMNNFLGVVNCNFLQKIVSFDEEITKLLRYRNFDICFFCFLNLEFLDYIFDFLHSSQDFSGGCNVAGISDPELDNLLETIKWGLVYEEKLNAAHQVQQLLVEKLVPYLYLGYVELPSLPLPTFFHSMIKLEKSSLTLSLETSSTYIGYIVKITGELIHKEDERLTGADVLLSYSNTGGESWNSITLAKTNINGCYYAEWMPTATGNYLIKAIWEGYLNVSDLEYIKSCEIYAHLSVLPIQENYVFSVISNSTISDLSFNSTEKTLHFTLSGPSETLGYATVIVAKTLVEDLNELKVYLDGNDKNYTAVSLNDSWKLHFTYHHSSLEVVVCLGRLYANNLFYTIIGISTALGIVVVIVVVYLKFRKRSKT